MTTFVNPYCQPLVQFNRNNADKINALCEPLKTHFGITAFGYVRTFDDGRYLFLTNNDAFLEAVAVKDGCFKTEYFSKQTELFCKYEPCMDIWPDELKDESIELYRARGFHNGFSIVKELAGSVECTWYSNAKENSAIKEFYRKHHNVLDDFMTHFRTIGGELTDPDGPANLGVSPYLKATYPQIKKIFKQTTPWERQILDFNDSLNSLVKQGIAELGRKNSLTLRELECLSYFTTGKTAKEIARILDVAPRTIEAHLNNIRVKTSCQTKIELTQWFEETFKPFLVKSPFGISL